MTENTEIKEPLPFDVVAFVLALIGGPIIVTLITAITIIPLFALIFGGPVYLVIGTPTLLWMVGRYPPDPATYAQAGLLSILALLAVVAVLALSMPADELAGAFYILLFGVIFAPLWASAFAYLYRRFNRVARLHPQS